MVYNIHDDIQIIINSVEVSSSHNTLFTLTIIGKKIIVYLVNNEMYQKI